VPGRMYRFILYYGNTVKLKVIMQLIMLRWRHQLEIM